MKTEERRNKIYGIVEDMFDAEFYEKSGLEQGLAVDGVDSVESRFVHEVITLEEAVAELQEIKAYYL